MKRIAIVGNSGSGKTTLARRLGRQLGIPFVELDSLFHQPGWTELSPDAFRAVVDDRTRGDTWVVDGNYGMVRDLVWARADTVVWLDLPRRTVMPSVIKRTVTRALTRQELWNGNREPLTNFTRWDPEQNIMRWAWTQHRAHVERYEAALADPAHAHLAFVRLRSRRAVEGWLARQRRPDERPHDNCQRR